MLSAPFLVLAVCNVALATQHARIEVYNPNGHLFPVDIELRAASMIAASGRPDGDEECFMPTINFHDYEKHLVAFKSVDTGCCYVTKTNESYNTAESIVQKVRAGTYTPFKQAGEEWTVPANPIEPDQVEGIVGTKIAQFASGYRVYMLEGGHEYTGVNAGDTGKGGRCWFGCVWCQLLLNNYIAG